MVLWKKACYKIKFPGRYNHLQISESIWDIHKNHWLLFKTVISVKFQWSCGWVFWCLFHRQERKVVGLKKINLQKSVPLLYIKNKHTEKEIMNTFWFTITIGLKQWYCSSLWPVFTMIALLVVFFLPFFLFYFLPSLLPSFIPSFLPSSHSLWESGEFTLPNIIHSFPISLQKRTALPVISIKHGIASYNKTRQKP